MKVFAKVNKPLFYTREGEVVDALSLPHEYAPYRLIHYRQYDFLGRATGNTQTKKKGRVTRIEVEIRYIHWCQGEKGKRPKALLSSVCLWVNKEDVAENHEVGFRYRNGFRCMWVMYRVAGQELGEGLPKAFRLSFSR